jgi:hypothetical protein
VLHVGVQDRRELRLLPAREQPHHDVLTLVRAGTRHGQASPHKPQEQRATLDNRRLSSISPCSRGRNISKGRWGSFFFVHVAFFSLLVGPARAAEEILHHHHHHSHSVAPVRVAPEPRVL